MKKIGTIAILLIISIMAAYAQQTDQSVQPADSSLCVFRHLPEGVTVRQSDAVRNAMDSYVERNARREAAGYLTQQTYRIRIFFDNGRNARGESEAAANRFKALHPGVSVSRTFTSPFFKVTVGNYSSKAEATKALAGIQREFPAAFIVRDSR